jgi:hypothetical protein
MSLPDLAPVLAVGGPVTLVGVCLRYGSDAIVKVVAGVTAAVTKDDNKGKRCVEVMRALRRRDDDPPEPG